MKRSRTWLLLALLLVIALVTSGCFQIRMFKLNKGTASPPGEMITVRVEAFPVSTSSTDTQVVGITPAHRLRQHRLAGILPDRRRRELGRPVQTRQQQRPHESHAHRRHVYRAGASMPRTWTGASPTGESWSATTEFGVDGSTSALSWACATGPSCTSTGPSEWVLRDRGDVVIFSGVWDDGLLAAGTSQRPEAGEVACTGFIAFSVP